MSDYEKCAKCGAVGQDRRTLYMACFYEMLELGVPFEKLALRGSIVEKVVGHTDHPWGRSDTFSQTWRDRDQIDKLDEQIRVFYTLRVCKGCRGEWMTAIQKWFRAAPGSNVQWNNDQAQSPETIDRLVARVEELRVETISTLQRLDDTLTSLRAEHDRRRRECSGPTSSKGQE